jgi:DNA polymerase-3 subunit beta
MELVVHKSDLLRELQLFQGIVERKNTIPILANVLLEAKGEEVKLLATDLEVALRSRCHAAVTKGGSLTLPAKKLYEIVKSLPETDIKIFEDKGGVKVAADRFDSRMQTLPREDFPALPEGSGNAAIQLPRAGLKEMVAKTHFAITGEDTRYFLNGALFVLRPDSMSLVATDGHRLALVTTKREAKGKKDAEELKPILPKKTLGELAAAHRRRRRRDLRARRESPFFQVGDRMLISRMIDGQFPAYERVIPKNNDKHRVRARSADHAVKRSHSRKGARAGSSRSRGKVDVTSSGPEFGEARETLPVDFRAARANLLQRAIRARFSLDGFHRCRSAGAEGEVRP